MEKAHSSTINLNSLLLICAGVALIVQTGSEANDIQPGNEIQSSTETTSFPLDDNQPHVFNVAQGTSSFLDVDSIDASTKIAQTDSSFDGQKDPPLKTPRKSTLAWRGNENTDLPSDDESTSYIPGITQLNLPSNDERTSSFSEEKQPNLPSDAERTSSFHGKKQLNFPSNTEQNIALLMGDQTSEVPFTLASTREKQLHLTADTKTLPSVAEDGKDDLGPDADTSTPVLSKQDQMNLSLGNGISPTVSHAEVMEFSPDNGTTPSMSRAEDIDRSLDNGTTPSMSRAEDTDRSLDNGIIPSMSRVEDTDWSLDNGIIPSMSRVEDIDWSLDNGITPSMSRAEDIDRSLDIGTTPSMSRAEDIDWSLDNGTTPSMSRAEDTDWSLDNGITPSMSHAEEIELSLDNGITPSMSRAEDIDWSLDNGITPSMSHAEEIELSLDNEITPSMSHAEEIELSLDNEIAPSMSRAEEIELSVDNGITPSVSHAEKIELSLDIGITPSVSHAEKIELSPDIGTTPTVSHAEDMEMSSDSGTTATVSHADEGDLSPNNGTTTFLVNTEEIDSSFYIVTTPFLTHADKNFPADSGEDYMDMFFDSIDVSLFRFTEDDFLDKWPFRSVISETFSDFQSQVVAIHIEMCGRKCTFPHEPLILEKKGTDIDSVVKGCSQCFCDLQCHAFGDCCPEIQLQNHADPQAGEISRLGNKQSTCEYSTSNHAVSAARYNAMINYCPRNFHTNPMVFDAFAGREKPSASTSSLPGRNVTDALLALRAKCENIEKSRHWDYHRPLTSRKGLVYRNKFCAQCHGERKDNLIEWSMKVECDGNYLLAAKSASDAYFLALEDPRCDISYVADNNDVKRDCQLVKSRLVTSCNQTGQWRAFDANIVRACASFTSVAMAKYKNAFCFLCNTNESFSPALNVLIDGTNDTGKEEANPGRISFSALLYPTEDDESADDVTDDVTTFVEDVPQNADRDVTMLEVESRPLCAKDYVLDPMQCVCRPVQCEAGLRIDGDKCTEVFLSTNMHAFSLCSRYHIKAEQPIRTSQMYSFFSSLMMAIDDFGPQFKVSFQGFPLLACDDNTSLTVDIHLEIHNGPSTLFTKRVKSILTFMKNFAGNSSAFHPAHMTAETPAPRCLDVLAWIKSLPTNCSATGSVGSHSYEMKQKTNVSLTPLYNTTLCPRVNLTKTEFSTFSTQLQDLGFTSDITFDVTFEKDETFYLLCAEDFRKILLPNSCRAKTTMPEDKTTAGFQDMWTVQGLVSMVSTCVSLVSLLCVMVTYMALPPLRAGTGLSTLAMACLLFVAQALHEMGLEQYEIHLLCLVLALLIHFFWLSAVFMMSSCTVQLFAALVFPLRSRMLVQSSGRKLLTISLALSLGMAAAVVGMTALGNQLIYGDVGYPGKHMCFIKRNLSRSLGFGLPVGLAVLLNMVLFVVTFTHLKRAPRLSGARKHRLSLMACFRLSVITGASWLSLFLVEIPGTRPLLEYVSVVLLGCQGLLLAITLLFNNRVFGLWKESRRSQSAVATAQENVS